MTESKFELNEMVKLVSSTTNMKVHIGKSGVINRMTYDDKSGEWYYLVNFSKEAIKTHLAKISGKELEVSEKNKRTMRVPLSRISVGWIKESELSKPE